MAIRMDEGPAGRRIDSAILPAQEIHHQLAAAVELDAKPIPADLPLAEIAGAELMVHPTDAGDLERHVANRQRTRGAEPGQGVVMRGLSARVPFAADAVATMDDGRALGCELER